MSEGSPVITVADALYVGSFPEDSLNVACENVYAGKGPGQGAKVD